MLTPLQLPGDTRRSTMSRRRSKDDPEMLKITDALNEFHFESKIGCERTRGRTFAIEHPISCPRRPPRTLG